MNLTQLELKDGELNSLYDRIINCRAIKPTYDTKGISGDFLMLDKRLGLLSKFNMEGITFKDYVDISGDRYYYGETETEGKIFNAAGKELYSKVIHSDSPVKIIKARGAGGELIVDATETVNNLAPNDNPANPVSEYTDPYTTAYGGAGLIALNIPGHGWDGTNERYITFVSGPLKGVTNKIIYADLDTCYISGTNVYGMLPSATDKYYIFDEPRDIIMVGTDDGVTNVILLGSPDAQQYNYKVNLTSIIDDIFLLKVDSNIYKLNNGTPTEIMNQLTALLSGNYHVELDGDYLIVYTLDDQPVTIQVINTMKMLDLGEMVNNFQETFFRDSIIVLEIDGIRYKIEGNVVLDLHTDLEGLLGAGYNLELLDGITYIWRDDFADLIIENKDIFGKLQLSDLGLLDSYKRIYQPISIKYGTEIQSWSGKNFNGTTYGYPIRYGDTSGELTGIHKDTLLTEYPTSTYDRTDRELSQVGDGTYVYLDVIYQDLFFNEVLINIPAGYTSEIITTNEDPLFSAGTMDTGYNLSRINGIIAGFNKKIFIYKTDLSDLDITFEETTNKNVEFLEGRTSSIDDISNEPWVDITYNGTTHRINNPTTSMTQVISLLQSLGFTTYGTYKYAAYNYDDYMVNFVKDDYNDFNISITEAYLPPGNSLNADIRSYTNAGGSSLSYTYDITNLNISVTNSSIGSINLNQLLNYNSLQSLTNDLSVIDLVEFEGSVFALTSNAIHFTRVTTDDNAHYSPLDFIPYRGGKKLIQFGHSLIVIGDVNKIIKKTDTTILGTQATGYLMKDLEFNGDMFSKYSYLYTDGILYLLQSDRRLMTLQIAETDTTESRVQTNEISKGFRYLFEDAEGECFMNQYGQFINILVINGEQTTNYQFDISRQVWMQNEYDTPIYNISDEVLTKDHIALESGYTDFGNSYEQEVNFSTGNLINLTKVDIIRTIFGLNQQDNLDVNLIVEREESSGNLQTTTHELNNYYFDTQLDPEPDLDELPGNEIQEIYEGNMASIQTEIQYAGRFMRLTYKSSNRFILGNSYLLEQKSKPYINDILTSN